MNVSVDDFEACMELIQERMFDEVPNINSGGCAFFATELMMRMQELGFHDANIRVFGNQFDSCPNICDIEEHLRNNQTNTLNEWNNNGVSFAHVVVEWNNRNWDALETFEGDTWKRWDKYPGFMSLKTVTELAYQPGWNRMFDPTDRPHVRKIMDECFSCLIH